MILKQKIIISLTLLILVIAGLSTWYILNVKSVDKSKNNPATQAVTGSTTKTIAELKAEISSEKPYLNDTASTSCNIIADLSKRNDCYQALDSALNAGSTQACDVLATEQDKTLCRQVQFTKEVAQSGDLVQCEGISNETNRIICISQAALKLAITKNDPSYCDKMAYPDDKVSCLKTLELNTKVQLIDNDQDGLVDSEEAKFFTDPKNPDTDGDGKSDGTEIKNGFNPCGTGKLTESIDLKTVCAKLKAK